MIQMSKKRAALREEQSVNIIIRNTTSSIRKRGQSIEMRTPQQMYRCGIHWTKMVIGNTERLARKSKKKLPVTRPARKKVARCTGQAREQLLPESPGRPPLDSG